MPYFGIYSASMKGIHNARANYLFEHFETSTFEMNICSMIRKLFSPKPSFTEQTVCDSCKHSYSSTFPLVSLNNQLFSNDFSNLEKAIMANFPEKLGCTRCKNDVECKREFGHHIFIEVIIIIKN